MSDKEMLVSDVYEQAAAIGQDIEVIRNTHGSGVIENVMPKLIFILDKLENLVAKHNDDSSKIQALLLEQADLTVRRNNAAIEKRNAEKQLEDIEALVNVSERTLEMKMKYLKMENKELSKQLKKRNKKIKKIKNGGERNSAFWLLDKVLFSGRIFFLTVELPRDIEAMRNVEVTIDSQKVEINRLLCEIEIKTKEKDSMTKTVSILSSANDCLENEAAVGRIRLSGIESNSEDGILQITDIMFSNRKDYRNILTENIYDQSDSDVTLSSISADDSRYWGEVDCKSSDEDERTLCTSIEYPINFNIMTVLDAATGNRKYKVNKFPCDNQVHEKENESITNDISMLSVSNEHLDNESSVITNIQKEVKVDIHSNRKDYKKLSLAKELRNNTKVTDEINSESTCENLYDLNRDDDTTLYYTLCYTSDDSRDESRYWGGANSSKSSDEEGHVCLADTGCSHNIETMSILDATSDNKNNEMHRPACENQAQDKEQIRLPCENQVQEEKELISNDINNELNQLKINDQNEIEVDIHSNREDYKTFSLVKELDHNGEKNLEPACDNYEQCENDVILNNICYYDEDNTCRDNLPSHKRKDGHLYFILDKKAMAVKKVGRDEYYQHALQKPLSPSKLSTTYDYQTSSRSLHV